MMETNSNHKLAVEYTAIKKLNENPRNVRTHSKKQIKAIADSIKSSGFNSPILIDDSNVIIAGHGRFNAAKLIGMNEVPTIRLSHMSEGQKRAYVLADNKLAERAGWDREMLVAELGELCVLLPEMGLSVDLTGFEIGEIDIMMGDQEEQKAESKDDQVEPVQNAPVSQAGDLWICGRHKILCGDARDPSCLDALLGHERADMVFTDPPFNVRVAGHVMGRGSVTHDEFAMASGEMSEGEFAEFLTSVLQNAVDVSQPQALHFVVMDWRHIDTLFQVGRKIYSEVKNLIVWAKTNGGQGSLYRSQHELIALFKVGDAEHVNNVELGRFGRNRSNVWNYAGANGFKADRMKELEAHPTVKPVALVADAIKDVTKRNAVVLDLFGGSGTTLIAAERTGRRGRLIEIEPKYVDATVRRFERLLKMDAVHAETGATFSETESARIKIAA